MNTTKNLSRLVSVFDKSALHNQRFESGLQATGLPVGSKMATLYVQLLKEQSIRQPFTDATKKNAQRLSDKMLTAALREGLMADFPNAYDHALYNCERNTVLAFKIYMNAEYDTARAIMTHALVEARKHHFTLLSM